MGKFEEKVLKNWRTRAWFCLRAAFAATLHLSALLASMSVWRVFERAHFWGDIPAQDVSSGLQGCFTVFFIFVPFFPLPYLNSLLLGIALVWFHDWLKRRSESRRTLSLLLLRALIPTLLVYIYLCIVLTSGCWSRFLPNPPDHTVESLLQGLSLPGRVLATGMVKVLLVFGGDLPVVFLYSFLWGVVIAAALDVIVIAAKKYVPALGRPDRQPDTEETPPQD